VFTMLSAMSFDPRLIWDNEQDKNSHTEEDMDEVASH
jgi:paraquat-inducible protein A